MNLLTPQIYTPDGFVKDDILGGKKALDVGCGSRKLPGAVGIDIVSTSKADIVHDLSVFPWPFKDDEFDIVFLNHSLEHMEDILKTMTELHRITKTGGRIIIQVPYFRTVDAFTDPTHRHFFTAGSLDYFVDGTGCSEYNYLPIRFKKLSFWYGWPHHSKNPFRELIKVIARHHPHFYDQYLSLLFPVSCVTWELEVV